MDRFGDLVEGMRCDLADINTGIRWAWVAGYGRAGRGLDAARGASLARSEAEVDRGPTYDLGIGDHACRVATQRVGRYLGDTEHVLARARIFAGWRDWPRFSFEYVTPGTVRHLDNLVLSARLCDRLIGDVELSYPSAHDLGKRKVVREVGKGHEYLRHAVGGLDRALRRGEESQPSVPECANAGCKNLASARVDVDDDGKAKLRTEGGLCDRCARYRRRNGTLPSGHKLSAELDRRPWAYQNKRRANGLDHGDESLSNAWKGNR